MRGVHHREGRAWARPLFPPAAILVLGLVSSPLPAQEAARGGGGEGFSFWFSRAVRALPPQRMITAHCKCGAKRAGKADFRKALAFLRKAWLSPGAASKVLDSLARDLVELDRVKGGLLKARGGHGAGTVPPRFRILLGRIQCAAKMVQWELGKRAGAEPRPRPPSSPLTEYVSRILNLVFLSPEGGALAFGLLSEKGIPPQRRACYLRGVHLDLLKETGAGRKSTRLERPWISGYLNALRRVARANQAFLEGEAGAERGRKEPGRKDRDGLPLDWKDLKRRWDEAGKLPRDRAFRAREKLVTDYLARGEDVETALQGADLFYRTYPGFCSLGPRGWANLAWKKGAVAAVLPWIRARWKEPEYRAAVSDALVGLWIGGGLVQRGDRALVERFMVETWKEEELPLSLRAGSLARIARAVTLPSAQVRSILLEACGCLGKGGNPELKEVLARAIRTFLERSGESSRPGPLEDALHRLSPGPAGPIHPGDRGAGRAP